MKYVEYFFECYFNMSADYKEVEDLVEEFGKIESEEIIQGFKKEVESIISLEDWNYIIAAGRINGGRILSYKKAEIFIKYLKALLEGDVVLNKPDFYSKK